MITSNPSDAIVMIDSSARVVFWNCGAEKMFSWQANEVIGRELHKFLAPNRNGHKNRHSFIEFVGSDEDCRIGKIVELTAQRKDGAIFPVSVSFSALQYVGQWHAIGVVKDITEQKKLNDVLQKNHASFKNLMEKCFDGVVVFDLKGFIQYVNPVAMQLFGLESGKMVGEHFDVPMASDDSLEVEIPVGSGGRKVVEMRRVETEWLGQPAFLAMLRDVTQRKHWKKGLKKAEKAAEQAYRVRTEFLSNISHELRSPLNSILILAEVLAENRKGRLSSEEVRFARTIHNAGRDLLGMINDLLDHAKAESGKMEFCIEPLKLDLFLKNLESQIQPLVQHKGLVLRTELAADVPPIIETSPQRLAQIIRNLLTNAVKFTDQGEINLRIGLSPCDKILRRSGLDPAKSILVSVSDTGIGIPADKLQQIFEPFVQVDGAISRQYGGTGLGLSISMEFAKLLGGEIQVESVEGNGSTFSLHLPCRHLDAMPVGQAEENIDRRTKRRDRRSGMRERRSGIRGRRGAEEKFSLAPVSVNGEEMLTGAAGFLPEKELLHDESPVRKTFEGWKILVVDDDMRDAFSITSILQRHGAKTLVGQNGEDGLDLLQRNPNVDLILMDMMMPVMNGFEAVSEIRRFSCFKDIPIVALTAQAMKDDREKCFAAGVSHYLAKPVAMHELLAICNKYLGDKKAL